MANKYYDLEARTKAFALNVRAFLNKLPRSQANREDGGQLLRASGSIGANYIEANESLSKKDFVVRVKICRKEAKESAYWLDLVEIGNNTEIENENKQLRNEATELMKIFGAILEKSK